MEIGKLKENIELFKTEQDNLRITQVCKLYKPYFGGVEEVVDQIKSIIQNYTNFQQEIISCSNEFKSEKHINLVITRLKYLFEFKSNNISLSLLFRLAKLKTNLIIYHQPYIFGVLAHFIARPKFKKMVVVYHSDIIGYEIYMKYFNWILKKFLSQTDKIFVLSQVVIESSKILQEFQEKCEVIPYGIDIKNLKSFNNNKIHAIKEIYKNRKILLYVGRLVAYKGLPYLIEAVKKVNTDAVLVIIGEGPMKKKIKSQIHKLNLKDRVFLAGKISPEEVPYFYQACDIFVFPSIMKSETFGIAQLEAMVYEKPVINTNLETGVNYVSLNNHTGLTVEPKNPKALANAINTMLNNEFLKKKFGENAKLRVEKYFSLERATSKYMEVFKGVLEY
jgi:rhamnosyl/mannosyltransferase